MEEIIYETPNGREYTEEQLRDKYGELFESYVSNGTFKKKNAPQPTALPSESSSSGFLSKFRRSEGSVQPTRFEDISLININEMPENFYRREGFLGEIDDTRELFNKKADASTKRIASGIARIPTFVQEFGASIRGTFDAEYADRLNEMTLDERERYFGATGLADASDRLLKEAEEIESTLDTYSTSIAEDFGAFRVGQGLQRLIGEIGGAVPSVALVLSNPFGFAALGSGTAADKSRQIQKAGGDLNFKTTSNALGTGVAEAAFELVTRSFGKRIYKALNGLPEDQAKLALQSATKEFAKGFGLEGASESLTLGTEEVLDALLLEDEEKFQASFYDYLDTFMIGGFVGGPLRSAPVGFAKVIQKREKDNLDKIIAETKYTDVIDAFKKPSGSFEVDIDQQSIVKVPAVESFLKATLQGQVNRGEITQAESDSILQNYETSVATFNAVSNLNLNEEQTNEALKLVQRKTELKKLIANKDEAIAQKEYDEIAAIDEKLKQISKSSQGVVTEAEALIEEAQKTQQEEGVDQPAVEVDQKVIDDTTTDNVRERTETLINALTLEGVDPTQASSLRRKAFIDIIKKIKPTGQLAARNAKALIRKMDKINFNKASSVQKTLREIINTFDTTAVRAQKKEAGGLQKSIKKAANNPKLEVNQSNAAKEFAKIDPKEVDDLGAYITKGKEVLNGIKSSKIVKGKLVVAPTFNLKDIINYSVKEQKKQEERQNQIEKDAFEELTDVDSNTLSLNEIREVIRESEQSEKSDAFINNKLQSKAVIIKDAIKNAFDVYAGIVGDQLKTGVDSFSGNEVDVSEADARLVEDFMKINPAEFETTAEAVQALDALINFATNSNVGGMGNVVARYNGKKSIENFKDEGIKAKSLRGILGRVPYIKNFKAFGSWVAGIASTPLAIETIFQSQRLGRKFMKASGLQDFINGVAKGKKIMRKIGEEYEREFKKKNKLGFRKYVKANGEKFNSAYNITERGLLGFMRRTVDGSEAEQNTEFRRRKDLIEASIIQLKNLGNFVKADFYQQAFDKLLKGSNNITEVEAKADSTNIRAVEWMTNKWAEFYPQLREINETIYNQSLENDINYTSDLISSYTDQQKIDFDTPVYDSQEYVNRAKIYDKQTGVLKPNQRIYPDALGNNRYVNLNFDRGQLNAMRKAVTNIETAYTTQYMKGFFESQSYQDIFPEGTFNEQRIIDRKVKNYVATQRGINYKNVGEEKQAEAFDKLASIGVARALSGFGQFIKQTAPIASTVITAGPINTAMAVGLYFSNKGARKFIDNSNRSITNRGVASSVVLDNLDSQAEKLAVDGEGRNVVTFLIDPLSKFSKIGLDFFLKNSDVATAQISFLAHYMNRMNSLGNNEILEPGFNWGEHEINDEAGDYAQAKVDREQNVSDPALQGELFTNRTLAVRAGLQLFMPFANFLLNRKTSMYSDITALSPGSQASEQDRIESAKSLVGFGAEVAYFNFLAYQLALINYGLSDDMIEGLGDDEIEPEEAKKRKENLLKGRATSIAEDIFSPLPPFSPLVTEQLNKVLKMIDEGEDPFQFYETKRAFVDDLGLVRIGTEVFNNTKEYVNIASTGEITYKDNQGKERVYKLDEEDLELAKYTAFLQTTFAVGGPNDFGRVANQNIKFLKRKAKRQTKRYRLPAKSPAKLD